MTCLVGGKAQKVNRTYKEPAADMYNAGSANLSAGIKKVMLEMNAAEYN